MTDDTNRPQPAWRLSEPLLGYLLGLFLSSVAASVALGLGAAEESVAVLVSAQLGLAAGFTGTVVLASKVRGSGSVIDDFRLWTTGADVAVGAAAGAALQLVAIPLLYLPLQFFFDTLDISEPARELLDRDGATVLLVLSVVVVAPVVEELFFRGLLLGACIARFGKRSGLVLSSVFFGATHFQVLQFPALTMAGLGFGWLAVRYNRLGPAIWAHIAFNAATVIVLS